MREPNVSTVIVIMINDWFPPHFHSLGLGPALAELNHFFWQRHCSLTKDTPPEVNTSTVDLLLNPQVLFLSLLNLRACFCVVKSAFGALKKVLDLLGIRAAIWFFGSWWAEEQRLSYLFKPGTHTTQPKKQWQWSSYRNVPRRPSGAMVWVIKSKVESEAPFGRTGRGTFSGAAISSTFRGNCSEAALIHVPRRPSGALSPCAPSLATSPLRPWQLSSDRIVSRRPSGAKVWRINSKEWVRGALRAQCPKSGYFY
jgi:hypothetical protein